MHEIRDHYVMCPELDKTRRSALAELEPVVVVVAPNAAADRSGKMRRENDPICVCAPGEKLLPRRTRRHRIHAEARTPVWITKLQRMVHEVGAENRFTPPAFDADHELTGRVAGRGLDSNASRSSMSVVDQFHLPRCEYRQHAVGDEIPCTSKAGDAGARSPKFPLCPCHQIARLRKRRYP